jgi:arylsulfatase
VVLPNRSPHETLEKVLPQRVPVQAGYPPLNLKRQYVPPADMLADPKQ